MKPNKTASDPTREILGGASLIVGFQLQRKHVLVVGGGKEAASRTFFALDANAYVTLISPEIDHPALKAREEKGLLRVFKRKFKDSDLDMKWFHETSTEWPVDMVLGCIDDPEESKRIALLARTKRIPVNCADIPELCDFFFMAQYRNEQLQIAVSTNGGGPRLGIRIRNSIVEHLDPYMPRAVTLIRKLRDKIHEVEDSDIKKRMGWVSRFCDSWSYKELNTLEDPSILQDIISSFKENKPVPKPSDEALSKIEPKIVNNNHYPNCGTREAEVPKELNSYWYCPQNMGYFGWIRMSFTYVLGLFTLLVKLAIFHVELLFIRPLKRLIAPSTWFRSVTISNGPETQIQNGPTDSGYDVQMTEVEQSISAIDQPNPTWSSTPPKYGKVYLCGAGPGHPDMLTVQALNLLNTVDMVVSDRLIPKAILDLIPPEKLTLSSFKVGGASDKAQDESNYNCLTAALRGQSVLRLKTGDPFVFGRGGEEVLFFRMHDIEPIIIPGLSSVFAGPSNCMIPVTHRNVADQVLMISGRGKNGSFPLIPEYYARRTIIVLMALSRLKELSLLFIEKNYPSDLPCAVIEKGTWLTGEKTVFGKLNDIYEEVSAQKIENPAMLVVGNVVHVLTSNDQESI
jgi:uroporphyrin-III C-methyltransferase